MVLVSHTVFVCGSIVAPPCGIWLRIGVYNYEMIVNMNIVNVTITEDGYGYAETCLNLLLFFSNF